MSISFFPVRALCIASTLFAGSAAAAVPSFETGIAPAAISPTSASVCASKAAPANTAECTAIESAQYTYTTLDYPGASATVIFALNNFGDLGGDYHMGTLPPHAMVYHQGQFESLDPQGVFGDNLSVVGGLNDWGAIVGGYADASTLQHGFLLQWGFFEQIDFPGHLNTNAVGINDLGAMIGVYWDADVAYHGVLRRFGHDTAINFAGSRETYPTGINTGGEIVGYWDIDVTELHSFLRSPSGHFSSIDVPSAPPNSTLALSINDSAQIAGYYGDTSGLAHGFILSHGRFQSLDVPGAVATLATVINNWGEVAGEYFDAAGMRHGFIATPQ